jgi:hypothetical protein
MINLEFRGESINKSILNNFQVEVWGIFQDFIPYLIEGKLLKDTYIEFSDVIYINLHLKDEDILTLFLINSFDIGITIKKNCIDIYSLFDIYIDSDAPLSIIKFFFEEYLSGKYKMKFFFNKYNILIKESIRFDSIKFDNNINVWCNQYKNVGFLGRLISNKIFSEKEINGFQLINTIHH